MIPLGESPHGPISRRLLLAPGFVAQDILCKSDRTTVVVRRESVNSVCPSCGTPSRRFTANIGDWRWTRRSAALETALYVNRRSKRGYRLHSEPDWPAVHRELKRKHVTLLIVWDEYIAVNPGGYSKSRFCELYRGLEAKLSPTMRQTHTTAERLFVDYAGDSVPVVIDRLIGAIRMAQIFVAVLDASSFTFARATWTHRLSSIGSTPVCAPLKRSAAFSTFSCRQH